MMLSSILNQRIIVLNQHIAHLHAIEDAKVDAPTKALWNANVTCDYAHALYAIEQEFKGLKTAADAMVESPPNGDHKMAESYRARVEKNHEMIRMHLFDAIMDTRMYLEGANDTTEPTDGKTSAT